MQKILYGLLSLLIFVVASAFKKEQSYKYTYIDTYCVLAIQEMDRSGIPASITLGQAIIESNFGTSSLAVNANNHFGIKCKSYWQGDTYMHKDDDYINGELVQSCFRSYDSSVNSYKDHTHFLSETERYSKLFELDSKDYKGWAQGLKEAGYATNPYYDQMLIDAIEKYNLHRFDRINLEEYRLKLK